MLTLFGRLVFVGDLVFSLDASQTRVGLPLETYGRPFWQTRLVKSPEITQDGSGYAFEYRIGAVNSLSDITSSTVLRGLAERLAALLARTGEGIAPHIILIGHGYGGLICEQVRETTSPNIPSWK